MQEFTQEQNIKEKNQIYYSSQSDPRKLSIATAEITKVPRSCEAANEVSKVEAQRGEENITSLLFMDPWSKGDYSRHIREASIAMDGLRGVSSFQQGAVAASPGSPSS